MGTSGEETEVGSAGPPFSLLLGGINVSTTMFPEAALDSTGREGRALSLLVLGGFNVSTTMFPETALDSTGRRGKASAPA